MDSNSYYYLASKNKIVRIGMSKGVSNWGVWLNDILVADGFVSAEEAAFFASRNDFPTEEAITYFNGVKVSAYLNMWRTTPPPQQPDPSLN